MTCALEAISCQRVRDHAPTPLPAIASVSLQCNAGQYRDDHNHWYCKYFYGGHLAAAGFSAMYMDNDAIVLSNPLQHADPGQYDLEGLSDLTHLDRLRPRVCTDSVD